MDVPGRAIPGDIDLEDCAREPIHVPGRVQPHGVLLTIGRVSGRIRQVSANSASLTDRAPGLLVGRELVDAVGPAGAAAIAQGLDADVVAELQTLVSFWIPRTGDDTLVDAVLHRVDGVVIIELLRAGARPRPVTFTDTYRRAQLSIAKLDASRSYDELLDVTASEVRRLTGFDRVMVYRFDEQDDGEVVAEQCREDLEPLLGLHYPADDIPAQARALYERSWLRLIADVAAVPVSLVPASDPVTGGPLDLSRAWLRAVSPVHIEYLRNMGVRASMSVSLLRDGRLWGLIACHHYSGAHEPDYETAATIELLGQLISSRIVDRLQLEHDRRTLTTRTVLSRLAVRARGPRPVAEALTSGGGVTVRDLVAADGVVVCLDGVEERAGLTLDAGAQALLLASARDRPEAWDTLSALGLEPQPGAPAGALVISLGAGQHVSWYRREVAQTVDWGGDPNEQAIAVPEGDRVRIGPRRSFDRWRQEIRGRCLPWSETDLESAGLLRAQLIEDLYLRGQQVAREALTLQLSLLPERLPEAPGWTMAARYLPTEGGRVGGDWYDAFTLPDGRVALVIGDVTGHGIAAAGTMSQLRNAMRAYMVESDDPATALQRLDTMVSVLLPEEYATCAAAILDPDDGRLLIASYGHPSPLLTPLDAAPSLLAVGRHPSLGLRGLTADVAASAFVLEPGSTLTLYTDGMVERRGEDLGVGLQRLSDVSRGAGTADEQCDELVVGCRDPASDDDATVFCIQRDAVALQSRPEEIACRS